MKHHKSPLVKIRELLPILPGKDYKIGLKFYEERRFEDLRDLVKSLIVKIEKNLNSENPKVEYQSINMDSLNELDLEVSEYCSLIESILNDITEDEYEGF